VRPRADRAADRVHRDRQHMIRARRVRRRPREIWIFASTTGSTRSYSSPSRPDSSSRRCIRRGSSTSLAPSSIRLTS
jgi:hypothetical protein